jgi:hypothetical protein
MKTVKNTRRSKAVQSVPDSERFGTDFTEDWHRMDEERLRRMERREVAIVLASVTRKL